MALNEANVLDNHNHDVWAYLALVSVKVNLTHVLQISDFIAFAWYRPCIKHS